MKKTKGGSGTEPFINDQIFHELSEQGILTVSGTGEISACSCGSFPPAPWEDLKDAIREICIQEGITEIGINAFRDCKNLQTVYLPDSLWKIGAYAFSGCSKLKEISFRHRELIYVKERWTAAAKDTVIFGVGAFSGVPWAEEYWNGFYHRNGELFISFPTKGDAIVPEGIRVLKAFSFSDCELRSLHLPESLETIEDCAFCNVTLRSPLDIPTGMTGIGESAFLGCRMPFPLVKPEMAEEAKAMLAAADGKVLHPGIPEFKAKYSLGLKKSRVGFMNQLVLRPNRDTKHKDGTITQVSDTVTVDIGKSITARLRSEVRILGLTADQGEIICLREFRREKESPLIRMRVLEKNVGDGVNWKYRCETLTRAQVAAFFPAGPMDELAEKGLLQVPEGTERTTWFLEKDADRFGGWGMRSFLMEWRNTGGTPVRFAERDSLLNFCLKYM